MTGVQTCALPISARFSTGYQLPDMQFAQNHAGRPDVAMFDFTCMHRAENASIVRERRGKKLLIGLVGDCLVEVGTRLLVWTLAGFLAVISTINVSPCTFDCMFRPVYVCVPSRSGPWGQA